MYVATSLPEMCNLEHICEELIEICRLLQITCNVGNFSITIIVNFSGVIYIYFFLGGGGTSGPTSQKKLFVAMAPKNFNASFPEQRFPTNSICHRIRLVCRFFFI